MKTNLKYLLKSDKFIKFQQTNLKTRPEEDSDINEVNIASFNTGTKPKLWNRKYNSFLQKLP